MGKAFLAPAIAAMLLAVAAVLVVYLPSGTASGAGSPPGDIDCDGDVDSIDALRILQRSAGIGPELVPCKATPDATETVTPTATAVVGSSRENPVSRGTPLLLPEGWEVTVLDFVPDATDLVLAESPLNSPPEAGMKYLFVRIRLTNVSAGDPAFHQGSYAPRLVGSNQLAYTQFYALCGAVPDGFTSHPGDVFPGGTVEANACFQVPEDETGWVMFTDYPTSDVANWRWFAVEE